jgi:hypothetical protein
MSRSKVVWKSPDELRPHPLNRELYGPPTANTAYKDIRADMQRNGFDERWPLLITRDGRIIQGITRWSVSKSLALSQVPCEIFEPTNPEQAELEIERELIRGNNYRIKTQLMVAREQRKMLEVEAVLARGRMGSGSDGGESKSTDRVGKVYGESGKTIQRRQKVLAAIEKAEATEDRRKADRLTELLEGKHLVKALEMIQTKAPKADKPVKVEVPRTFNDYSIKAYSEFFEACAKVRVSAELEILEATLGRMRDDLSAARARLSSK